MRDGSPLTSQQGNENNNMAEDDPIFQGEFVKLSESRRLFIGSKTDSWKPKHILLRRKGEKPILEYHKKKQKNVKKGEKTLTHSFELWPTFKVEKLTNARGRSFVCEITAPDIHQFVSSDQETDIDIFVFLLQSQIRLKENLREDIISVVPDESEAQIKIGAKGSKCFLHISPWGITLALAKSRALLAQWPLKSIRYYETSGGGHFTIEAGRVAPMGEGVFGFRTASGEDDKTYDLVDNYIVNTLDRVKPSQRGTQEEIEDYIREHDFLHSLTMVHARARSDAETKNVLWQCWNIGRGAEQSADSEDLQPTHLPTPPIPSSPTTTTQMSRLNVTLERSISTGQGSSNTFPADAKSSKRPSLVNDSKTASSSPDGRPPLPGRAAKRSRRREHSLPRKIDVVTHPHPPHQSSSFPDDGGGHGGGGGASSSQQTTSPDTPPPPQQRRISGTSKTPELQSKQSHNNSSSSGSVQPPRRHSNPSSVLHAVNPNPNNLSPLSIQSYQNHPQDDDNQHHHTEFYNLNSPNLKVRISKSPVVTRHPNKVGRAEYLLSVQESGVRSPTSPELGKKDSGKWDFSSSPGNFGSDEENLETKKYMEAVARASKKKYGGGHNSLDRTWGKSGIGNDRMSLGVDSLLHPESKSSSGYVNAPKVSGGYVNLNNKNNSNNSSAANTLERKLQDRQNSVESFASALSRQNSVKNNPSSPPPPVHHHRQRSAPLEEDLVDESGYQISPLLRKKVGEKGGGSSSHEDSGVSLRSRSSQLSSDDGLSRDSAHSIGSFRSAVSRQPSGFGTLDSRTDESSPVKNWLMSASCEDLSDHMRHVIFQDDEGGNKAEGKSGEEYESTYEEIRNTDSEEGNNSGGGDAPASSRSEAMSDDKPPLPFTGLKKFQSNATSNVRDRSKSFGYMNMPQPVASKDNNPALPAKQQSSAPSAHLIRKMVSARAKQDTLRKSLSNPNFLNLGSKEQLFKLKISSSRNNVNSSSGNLSSVSGEKLSTGTKQKSRSFGNLFPAIKKALSRESIGNGASRSTTPERRSSFRRSSFSFRRKSTDNEVGLRRQNSLHVQGEMTIKGIRMTARSRSFRRVRETKSVDSLSMMTDSAKDAVNNDESDLTETYATISRSPATHPKSSNDSSPANPPQPPSRNSTGLSKDRASRKSSSSVQLRTSASNSSLKSLPNPKQIDSSSSSIPASSRNSKTKSKTSSATSSPQLQMRTSASSSSLKATHDDSNSQSSSSSAHKSNLANAKSPSTKSNPSYSANLNITLSSPQNEMSLPPTVSASNSNANTSSEHKVKPLVPNPSTIASSSTQPPLKHPPKQLTIPTTTTTTTVDDSPPPFPPPPPPLPPRQKSTTSISIPTKNTKSNATSSKSSKQNSSSSSSSYSNSLVHKPGFQDNTKYNSNNGAKSVTSSAYISPNYINANRCSSSNVNDNTNSNNKTATKMLYCQKDDNGNSSNQHPPPFSIKEIPTSASRQLSNGDSTGGGSASPARRRSRFDKVAPKS